MSNADPKKLAEYLTAISFDDAKRNRDSWLQQADAATQEAYRNAMEVLSSLEAGGPDPWMRGKIHKIIRKSTRYIIYLDDQYSLRWWWLTRPNERAVSLVQARISQLSKESAFLLGRKWRMRATSPDDPSVHDIEQVVHIRSVMGEALALALSDASVEECEAVLAEAKRYIAVAKDQRTRPAFLAFFLLTVGILGAVLWLWICYGERCCVGEDAELLYFIRRSLEAAFAGSFGAMISAMTRTRDLGLEPVAGLRSLIVEAVARALIGAGTAILLSLAFDSGILVKSVLADDPMVQQYFWVFLCVAAGLSERMLPALVGRAESLVNGQAPTGSSGGGGQGGGGQGGGGQGGGQSGGQSAADKAAAEKAAAEKAAAEKAAAEKAAAEKTAAESAAAEKAAAEKAAADKKAAAEKARQGGGG